MKEFEIVCPLTREPRLKEIEAKAGGWKWVLKKRSIDARKEPVWRYQYEAYGPGENYVPYELPEYLDVHDAEPDGHAVSAGGIGEVCPSMGIDLELVVAVVATLHATEADVVSGSLIANAQREDSLQQGIAGAPVHLVLEVDACCLFALVEVDALHDV